MNLETKQSPYRAERYYLGEMTPAEQEEFEREMFESPELGEEVRDLHIFAENAKSVLAEERSFQPSPVAVPLVPVVVHLAGCLAGCRLRCAGCAGLPRLRHT